MAAFRESSIVTRSRNRCLGYLMAPPIILTGQAMGLGAVGWIFILVILLAVDRIVKRHERPIRPGTFRLWLTFWLIEAGLPISLHFVFRKSGDAERVALIVAGIALILGGLLAFLVIAPDLWEHAD